LGGRGGRGTSPGPSRAAQLNSFGNWGSEEATFKKKWAQTGRFTVVLLVMLELIVLGSRLFQPPSGPLAADEDGERTGGFCKPAALRGLDITFGLTFTTPLGVIHALPRCLPTQTEEADGNGYGAIARATAAIAQRPGRCWQEGAPARDRAPAAGYPRCP